MALQISADVATAETAYGTVLLDRSSGRYWELNPTGTLILEALLKGGAESDAVDAIVAEFEVERAEAERDATALLEQLRAAGLTTG